jgi:hypothetical protein
MLKIGRRTAMVGTGIPSRTEKHGDENVTALDIPLGAITLAPTTLEELLPGASERLFDSQKNPVFTRLKAFRLREKIESARVTLWLGLDPTELVFADVKLTKGDITPTHGGGADLSLTVQVTPDLDESIALLLGHLNQQVEVEIEAQHYGSQGELELPQREAA